MRRTCLLGVAGLLMACNGGEGTDTDTQTPEAGSGDLVWAAVGTGTGGAMATFDYATAVDQLADGTLVVAIRYDSDIQFGGETFTASGGVHATVVGLDPSDGSLRWSTELGSLGSVQGSDLSIAADGDRAVLAVRLGTGHDLLGLDLDDGRGFAVVEVDADGASVIQTITCASLSPIAYFPSISVDDDDSLLFSTQFVGTCVADPGGTPAAFSSNNNSQDLAILRLSAGGAVEWVRTVGGPGRDWIGATTLIDGGYILGGGFAGTVDFDGTTSRTSSASGDIFVARYSDDGAVQWVTTGAEDGDASVARVVVTSTGDVAAAGEFGYNGTLSDLAVGAYTLDGDPSADAFVLQLDGETGEAQWLHGQHSLGIDQVQGLAAHPDGGVVLTSMANGLTSATNQLTTDDGFAQSLQGPGLWVARRGGDGGRIWERLVSGGTGIDVHVLADGATVVVGDVRSGAVLGAGEANEQVVQGEADRFHPVVMKLVGE